MCTYRIASLEQCIIPLQSGNTGPFLTELCMWRLFILFSSVHFLLDMEFFQTPPKLSLTIVSSWYTGWTKAVSLRVQLFATKSIQSITLPFNQEKCVNFTSMALYSRFPYSALSCSRSVCTSRLLSPPTFSDALAFINTGIRRLVNAPTIILHQDNSKVFMLLQFCMPLINTTPTHQLICQQSNSASLSSSRKRKLSHLCPYICTSALLAPPFLLQHSHFQMYF